MANLTDIIDQVSPVNIQDLEDAPFCVTYTFPAKDFGNGGTNWTEVIESPPGFRGKVRALTLAVDASDSPVLTDGATHIIEPNTTVHVTGVAVTGALPTGIATVAVTIQYFK